MENPPTDPIEVLITKFKALTLGKKVALIITCLVMVFIFYSILNLNDARNSTDLSSDTVGMMAPNVTPSMDRYDGGNMAKESMPIDTDYVTGADAEEFETRNLTVRFETQNLADTCEKISALKQKEEVIFLSAYAQDTSCSYSFKVTNAEAENVVNQLKELNPKVLNEQTQTIKKQIENSLNRRDILTQNLTSTEEILQEALNAYDNLLAAATLQQNATALATAINDKINLIDRLKQRREQTMQAIDSLNRQLAEQNDQLEYTYFSVSVVERVYVDGKQIADSWKYALKRTVNSMNELGQQLTLGLFTFIMYTLLYALYLIIILVIAKFSWRIVRAIAKS